MMNDEINYDEIDLMTLDASHNFSLSSRYLMYLDDVHNNMIGILEW